MSTISINLPDFGTIRIAAPHECPICHHMVVIIGVNVVHNSAGNGIEAVYSCPNTDCGRFFIASYEKYINDWIISRVTPIIPKTADIPSEVKTLSPQFVEIFIQAMEAKENGLDQICGPGFRKAFEFLIKDYAKSKTTDETEVRKIEATFSGNVINEFIGNIRIQAVGKRALWLGNDETHYLRKWEKQDIVDLINLIQLTIRWIEIELRTDSYVTTMPDS